jgi:hypothetical protein
MLSEKFVFTPVFGKFVIFESTLPVLLPQQVLARFASSPEEQIADEVFASLGDALELGSRDEFYFASEVEREDSQHGADYGCNGCLSSHDHDHGSIGNFNGNGIPGVVLPSNGNGSLGIFLEDDGFANARPGSDTDSGGSGGGGGNRPPKDDGGSTDGGDAGDTSGILSTYTSGGNERTSYNITLNFDAGGWTAAIQQIFIDAAEYLSTIVLGDLSNERVPLVGRVDDLAIDASIIEMDGEGGVLGGAAVFASRVGSELPAASIMQFDIADIGDALTDGYLSHVVVHEMVHALGFGGKWMDMGLVQTFSETDEFGVDQQVLRFTGGNATAEYNKMAVAANDPYSANGVLLETDGGQGTADVHWDDETFGDLLMTGFIDIAAPGDNRLSIMSIAALEDMGYDTIYEPALDGLIG